MFELRERLDSRTEGPAWCVTRHKVGQATCLASEETAALQAGSLRHDGRPTPITRARIQWASERNTSGLRVACRTDSNPCPSRT